jgi:REP element-mobilizing transposase RayT
MNHRRSIRLREFDYTASGAYFITICTDARRCVFGSISEGHMQVSAWGEIVIEEWTRTASLRPTIELDAFVVMPNHVHGIVIIHGRATDTVRTQRAAPLQNVADSEENLSHLARTHGVTKDNVSPGSLGAIVRSFKSAVTSRIHALATDSNQPIWQRNYYEHIIRSEESLNRIRAYIHNNPSQWTSDSLFTGP